MKIGLDFDGVVSDCGELKSYGAKTIYNVEISPDRFKMELVVDAGILTLEQYRHIQQQIYGTREIGLRMLPVKGALEFIPKLQREGHVLKVITSRNSLGTEIAEEWIRLKGLKLSVVGIGNERNKVEACGGLDIYIDDDLDKIEPLSKIVPHRYLFSWGYNQHISTHEVAQRITSWQNFYDEVNRLNRKR